MAAVTAWRKPSPTATPERQALADRIAVRNASDRDFAALEAATGWNGHCRQAINAARGTIENTSEAIKENIRRAAVNKALGIDAPPEVSIEELRATQAAAQSALDAALVDQEAVEARLKEETERRRWRPDFGVRDAALAVIKAETSDAISALVERVEKAQCELMASGRVLLWLDWAGAVPRGQVSMIVSPDIVLDERAGAAIRYMKSAPIDWPVTVDTQLPWTEALALLENDATAPLPEVP